MMHGISPKFGGRPFGLPEDSIEITLHLPMPPSTNAIWRSGRGRTFKSKKYKDWLAQADMAVIVDDQYPPLAIGGPFSFEILLSTKGRKGRDGDNYIKAAMDFLQSRELIRDDSDCRRGSWEWVEPRRAPRGCRVTLRSLHGAT